MFSALLRNSLHVIKTHFVATGHKWPGSSKDPCLIKSCSEKKKNLKLSYLCRKKILGNTFVSTTDYTKLMTCIHSATVHHIAAQQIKNKKNTCTNYFMIQLNCYQTWKNQYCKTLAATKIYKVIRLVSNWPCVHMRKFISKVLKLVINISQVYLKAKLWYLVEEKKSGLEKVSIFMKRKIFITEKPRNL